MSSTADEVTIHGNTLSTTSVDNLGEGTRMKLPLILGKAGKMSQVAEYRNANDVQAEHGWSDEGNQDETGDYTRTTVVGDTTPLGGHDSAIVRLECGHHEDTIREMDVGHHGSDPISELTSTDAWQYP